VVRKFREHNSNACGELQTSFVRQVVQALAPWRVQKFKRVLTIDEKAFGRTDASIRIIHLSTGGPDHVWNMNRYERKNLLGALPVLGQLGA